MTSLVNKLFESLSMDDDDRRRRDHYGSDYEEEEEEERSTCSEDDSRHRRHRHSHSTPRKRSKSKSSSSNNNNRRSNRPKTPKSSTRSKAEYLMRQMFGQCSSNMSTTFSDMFQETHENDRDDEVKGRDSYSTAETEVSSSNSHSRDNSNSHHKKQKRSSRRRREGRSQSRSRRRSKSASRRRTPSRSLPKSRSEHHEGNARLLPDHAEIEVIADENDDVSAISARTLEEMASRHSRMRLLRQHVRKEENTIREEEGGPVEQPRQLPQHEYMYGEEEEKSEDQSIGQMSSNTTEFESIWKRNVESSSPNRVGIYEEAEMRLKGEMGANASKEECTTPLARKLKRHEKNREQWRNRGGVDGVGTGGGGGDDDCMLRPDEYEI